MITTNEAFRDIPAGSTIVRTYWTYGVHYTIGPTFDTEVEAIEAIVEKTEADVARHLEHHGPQSAARYPHPEAMTVDLRWIVSHRGLNGPDGTRDVMVSRTTYADIADAQAHLERIAKFSGAGPR
jgi:hypothetical protein